MVHAESKSGGGGAMAKKAGKLFVTAYLLLIFGIYPFYMREGYVDIGRAALGILALIGVFVGCRALAKGLREHAPYLIDWDKVSMTDLLVLMYAAEIFLSFVMSDYRQEALWGTEGWFMGTVLFGVSDSFRNKAGFLYIHAGKYQLVLWIFFCALSGWCLQLFVWGRKG